MINKKTARLGKDPLLSLLIKLSIPGVIGMFIQALYSVVDSIFLGHLSTDALSAISLCFPIQMLMISLAAGTGIGTTSLISRFLGQNDPQRANNTAEHVILLALIYGLISVILGVFFAEKMITLFTNDKVLIDLSTRYIKIIMIGSIFTYIAMIFNTILRGEGNTIFPMITMALGAILNIILDPFLIFGLWIFPKMGIEGAAYASVISRAINALFITIVLFYGNNQIKIKLQEFKFDISIFLQIFKIGFPAIFMHILGSFMIAGINKICANYDTMVIALVGIFFKMQSFILMPVFGISQGLMPIVGYNYGHKNPKRVIKSIKYAMIISTIFSLSGFILLRFFPYQIIRLFNGSPQMEQTGAIAFKIIALGFPVIGIGMMCKISFMAIGRGMPSLIASFARQIVILLPAMFYLSKIYGIDALWYAFPISDIFSFLLIVVMMMTIFPKEMRELKMRELE